MPVHGSVIEVPPCLEVLQISKFGTQGPQGLGFERQGYWFQVPGRIGRVQGSGRRVNPGLVSTGFKD